MKEKFSKEYNIKKASFRKEKGGGMLIHEIDLLSKLSALFF
jgi:hypothetical protein